MDFCDRCGDVDTVCDYTDCERHRCVRCRTIASADEHEYWSELTNSSLFVYCFECEIALTMEDALADNRNEIVAGDAKRELLERWLLERHGLPGWTRLS